MIVNALLAGGGEESRTTALNAMGSMEPNHPMHVLFVCTGNQCRSAAAAAILRQIARNEGIEVEVMSAGTHAWQGIPAQQDTVTAARRQGFELSSHMSQPMTKALLDRADVVLAMAGDHIRWLHEAHPEGRDRIYLFKPYCEGRVSNGRIDDIADPVSQPLAVHEACVREIADLLREMVTRWKRDAT